MLVSTSTIHARCSCYRIRNPSLNNNPFVSHSNLPIIKLTPNFPTKREQQQEEEEEEEEEEVPLLVSWELVWFVQGWLISLAS